MPGTFDDNDELRNEMRQFYLKETKNISPEPFIKEDQISDLNKQKTVINSESIDQFVLEGNVNNIPSTHYHTSVKVPIQQFLSTRKEEVSLNNRGCELLKSEIEDFFVLKTPYDSLQLLHNDLFQFQGNYRLSYFLNIIKSFFKIRFISTHKICSSIVVSIDIIRSCFYAGFIFSMDDNNQKIDFPNEDSYYNPQTLSHSDEISQILQLLLKYNGFLFFSCECFTKTVMLSNIEFE